MKLGFEQAVIALGLCVATAGFLYFYHVTNLYRGLGEDHPEERLADNHHQERNRKRGKGRGRGRGRQRRGSDWPRSENLTANSPLRQRPRPQENDEPLWRTVGSYKFFSRLFYFCNYLSLNKFWPTGFVFFSLYLSLAYTFKWEFIKLMAWKRQKKTRIEFGKVKGNTLEYDGIKRLKFFNKVKASWIKDKASSHRNKIIQSYIKENV